MTEKLEFGSARWFDHLFELVRARLDSMPRIDRAYSFCEEFTEPPEHLLSARDSSIGWYVRLHDGTYSLGRGIINADAHVKGDYPTMLAVARSSFVDPVQAAEARRLLENATTDGTFSRVANKKSPPELAVLGDVHDEMARITA